MAGHPHRPLGLELFTDTTSEALIASHNIFKQADIINLHWTPDLLDVKSMPEILSGKRIIWTLHDQNSFTGGCHYAGDCLKFQTFCHACPQLDSNSERDPAFQQWQVKKLAYDAIDFEIVTTSKWLAEQAKTSALFAGRQIYVIPYGLPLGLFQPRPTQDLRQKFGLSEDDFVLMFGTHAHTNRMGFQSLKQLLEVIPPRLQGKRVVVAALGHFNGGFPKRIPLLELGFVGDPSRLAEFYSMADAYVLPAVEDNLPNTAMEVMACGTPVVGFEIGGMPDMVQHGDTGWLAKLGDVDGLVQGIMWAKKFGGRARKDIATKTRQHFNDGVQAKRYERLYYEGSSPRCNETSSEILPPIPTCEAKHFELFSYAKESHFIAFSGLDISLYGKPIDPQRCDLKRYQDALILTFITANIPNGARILEVGGGNSRILEHLKNKYECWNVDKFEGIGSGPKEAKKAGYRIVLDYMGNCNPTLQDDYFDFVFSISALEHTPEDPALHARILMDINRVLKPGGFSLHLFDVVFKPEGFWTNPFLPYLFKNASPLYPMPASEEMQKDPDLFVMTKKAYDSGWKKITGKAYEEFGQPSSINILWRKSSKASHTTASEILHLQQTNNDVQTGPEILVPSSIPTISIVTPSFNQGVFLEECIDSILSQGYPNLEYIIMDGGSTDGSIEIIKRYEKHLKYWQSKKDEGQYWAINEGFNKSSGDIMAWLNSDDKYHHGALYKTAFVFSDRPDVEWIVGKPTAWNEDGSLNRIAKEIPLWNYEQYIGEWPKKMFIQQESVFWRRSLWNKSGAYIRTDMQYAGDFELWIRFFRHAKLFSVDTLLGGYRYQANQKVGKNSEGFKKYLIEAIGIAKKEFITNLKNNKTDTYATNNYVDFDHNRFDTYLTRNDILKSTHSCMADSVSVFTSLMPREIDKQRESVNSWIKMGINVISINSQIEKNKLSKHFNNVEFVEASRDGKDKFGKPLIYFDDILSIIEKRNESTFGITNSDIILKCDFDIKELLILESKGAFIYGNREDVTSPNNIPGTLYTLGFDTFFFDRTATKLYPKSDFCIGAPWWDYWAPLMPLLQGMRIKTLNKANVKLLHVLHTTKWSADHWLTCGNMLSRAINEHLNKKSHTHSAELISKKFSSGFFNSLDSEYNNLFSDTIFVRNTVNILGEESSSRIKYLRFLGKFILEFINNHTCGFNNFNDATINSNLSRTKNLNRVLEKLDLFDFLNLKFHHEYHDYHEEGTNCIYQDLIKNQLTIKEIIFAIQSDNEFLDNNKYNHKELLKNDHMNHYINCIKYGFRKEVEEWKIIESTQLVNVNYYKSKHKMNDYEVQKYLEMHPIKINNGTIIDGIHRSMCQIGRLLRGEPYIPFLYTGGPVIPSRRSRIPNIGYRKEHNLYRMNAIQPHINKKCFKALDIGSNYGYFSLNIANNYPNSQVFSIEGEFGTGNKENKGLKIHNAVKNDLKIFNNFIYHKLMTEDLILKFNEKNYIFDYQISFSVFHWIVYLKYKNNGAAQDIKNMLINHLIMSNTTFLELPSFTQDTSMSPLYANYDSFDHLFSSINKDIPLKFKKIGECDWYGKRELFCIDINHKQSNFFTHSDIDLILNHK